MPPPSSPVLPPQVYHYEDLDSGFTCANAGYHEQASAVCANKKQRLCSWDEICPGGASAGAGYPTSDGHRLATWLGGVKPSDEWVAVTPVKSNSLTTEWIQIGTRANDICIFISSYGYNNYNSWGCQPYTGYIACCTA